MIFMAKSKHVGLTAVSVLVLLASLTLCIGNVQAQNQVTVVILPAIGGTSNPAAGTYEYNDGETVTVTAASANLGATFSYWLLTADNDTRQSTAYPLTFTVSAGVTYVVQPVFEFTQFPGVLPTPDLSDAAVVDILPASGGTTIPAPGKYAFTNATAFNITAMPDNGWVFSHWVISGDIGAGHGDAPLNLEPTDNPYNVNHGYGSVYAYQPVFTQSSNPSPSPTIPEFSILAVLLLLAALIPAVALAKKRNQLKLPMLS
jgi:hypothetical protein